METAPESGHAAHAGAAGDWIPRESTTWGLVKLGGADMTQAPDLRELGPTGNDHGAVGESQGPWTWGRRRTCEGLDPREAITSRAESPRGCGHGAGAGPARARTVRERPWGGRAIPGGVGMGQSPELPGLGRTTNPSPQDEDWKGRGVGGRVNSSANRKVGKAWRMRNPRASRSGSAGPRCSAGMFASSARAIRSSSRATYRASFPATVHSVMRKRIRRIDLDRMCRRAGPNRGQSSGPGAVVCVSTDFGGSGGGRGGAFVVGRSAVRVSGSMCGPWVTFQPKA